MKNTIDKNEFISVLLHGVMSGLANHALSNNLNADYNFEGVMSFFQDLIKECEANNMQFLTCQNSECKKQIAFESIRIKIEFDEKNKPVLTLLCVECYDKDLKNKIVNLTLDKN